MLAALFTKSTTPPSEFRDMVICRDLYHCTPSELDAQDADRVELDWFLWQEELRIRAMPGGS